MKTFSFSKPVFFALGAVLAFSPLVVRADDDKPVRHHKRPAKVAKAVSKTDTTSRVASRDGAIPTRDGRHSQEVEGGSVGGANGEEYRVPTGSQIPQRYHRRGYTTDSKQNLQIIDENDQRFRSQDNVSEILRADPSISVRGGRGL